MVEKLKELIENGDYIQARNLANQLFMQGEQSEVYWILNATLYQIEGQREAEFACMSRGLQKNPSNYELYYMLGNYYGVTNINQAYLCYEQAVYYCDNEADKAFIQEQMKEIRQMEGFSVHPVSIVILSYNIKDILIGCVESIRNTCPKEAYELVIVDNASTDGVTDWLKEQSDIVLRCNTENAGFAGGCNQGIEMAAPENDIMLLNNDTLMPPNALFWMRIALYERETVGAVGPITNYAGNDQQLVEALGSIEEYFELSKQICVPMPNCYENKLWLVGFAMIIKRCAVDKVGGLDTRYGWGNYEDNDYGMKLSQAGYELLLCHNSFVFHYGSLNMSKEKEKYLHYMEINQKKLIDKWGFDVPYYTYPRKDLIAKVNRPEKEKIVILEIGCGCGATLGKLKYMYPNAELHGIELVESVASYGKYLANIIAGNIENIKLPYEKERFDYIICGDVLEHLHEPERVLSELREYLKQGGKLIASIPNIMNISVIVELLKGNFTYKDAGILDRTHIHFFTKKEIEKMLVECGYKIISLDSIEFREPLEVDNEELIEAIYQLPGIAEQEEFETYQYIVVAEGNCNE